MRFETLIGLRYLRARRRERFVSLIAVISLAGVALGTFALTVTLAVMSGFQEVLRENLLAFTPQVTIERAGGGSLDGAPVTQILDATRNVVSSQPYVTSQVMAVATTSSGDPGYVAGGMVRGVEVNRSGSLEMLSRTLEAGHIADLAGLRRVDVIEKGVRRGVDLPGAIIGRVLADELGLRVGDTVVLISPASLGSGVGTPRLRRFAVVGLFHSGMYDFDSALIFVDIKYARTLLADDPQLETGVEIRLRDMFDAPAVAGTIAGRLGAAFKVTDWTHANAPLFAALKLEKLTYFVVLMLIVLVAAFNIIATLVMVVMERRKEIAILRTMGARAASIAAIFLCEGAALGVIGTFVGVGAGFVTSYLIARFELIHLPADMFMISAVPARLYPVNFIAVAISAIALCVGAALYPAVQARRLSPVEVIRYD
jgi:lipoprotein-releasing system permease protein